jgi:uncharacterized protein YehS (DUF1456 family)
MLRDDQIVEILELVDFWITKSELLASEMKHENIWNVAPSVAQFLKCFSHSFTRNKENQKAPLTS